MTWLRLQLITVFITLSIMNLQSTAAADSQKTSGPLPDKIISGYCGWYPVNDYKFDTDTFIKKYLDQLQKAGFTCFTAKIQNLSWKINLEDPKQFNQLKILADACKKRNLALLTYVYLYPDHRCRRNPKKHKDHPPLVLPDGKALENQFSLVYWPTWRMFLEKAYQLAKASRELPIAAVQVDLEHLGTGTVSYDDVAWKEYCKTSGLPVATAAKDRYKLLKSKGLVKNYEDFFYGQIEKMARRYEREMHEINPKLSLGVMPDKNARFILAFEKVLGTPQAPAIIDNWLMYNGGGLTGDILKRQKFVKGLNPNNRFICWFRPDNYSPDDIKVQAYHAIRKTDGYNMWHLRMLCDPATSREKIRPKYKTTDYFNAFNTANRLALKDIAGDKKGDSIPFKAVTSMVAELDMKKLAKKPVPPLAPAGKGSGKPQWIRTRATRCFYIHANPGEELKFHIRHVAGKRRPTSLQYVLLSPSGKVLRKEPVSPSQKESISIPATEKGIHTLYVSGGKESGPWFSVLVENPYMAIPASKQDHARFFRPPATMWICRKNLKDPAKITVTTGRNQMVELLIDGKSFGMAKPHHPLTVDIPKGNAVQKVTFKRPDKLAKGIYCQTVWCYVSGAVYPYLFSGPERRLAPTTD